jgi:hypothetical protein
MGIMTLAEFRQDIVEGLQRGTDPAAIPGGVERLDRWIHNAMYEFAYALKFHELEGYTEQTLLAETNELTIPEDFRVMHEEGLVIIGTEGSEGTILKESRKEYIRKNRTVGSVTLNGRPRYYHVYGSAQTSPDAGPAVGLGILLRPKADVDYTIGMHYWKRITRLINTDDLSPFSDDWDDVIYTGALYRGFRHFNEFDRYQNVRNDFLGLVRSRKMEEDLEEFPEGGISVADWRSREGDSAFGTFEEPYGEID